MGVKAPIRPNYRQPSRKDTVMIAAHFERDVSLAFHELLGTVSRRKGQRVTVQAALGEALRDYFKKHGAAPPPDLKPK